MVTWSTYVSILDGKYNTNMRVFVFLFCLFLNEYLEVATVNMTFYIYTSAYQFRISNCNEGRYE